MDKERDWPFIESLCRFHMRREAALGLAMPSDLLLSLRSFALNEVSMNFIETTINLQSAMELMDVISNNKAKADRLIKKIKRSRSKTRQRTWYTIVLRLYDEAAMAEDSLRKLSNDSI